MDQLGYFLYHMKTAPIPVRVSDLTIGTRKEATDDLSIQLGISTIFLADAAAAGDPSKPAISPTSREATR